MPRGRGLLLLVIGPYVSLTLAGDMSYIRGV